jgi:TfoX/Sxy family transcriptional regulator of competence genes
MLRWGSSMIGRQEKRRLKLCHPAHTQEAVVAQPYLKALEEFVVKELPDSSGLVCKHFFGGAALYSNSMICASLTRAGFAFKLPEQRCRELLESGKGSPLRYFRKSPVKKGYVLFADGTSLDAALIASYLNECVAYANSFDA